MGQNEYGQNCPAKPCMAPFESDPRTLSDPGAVSDPENVQNCSSSDPGSCRPVSAK